MIMKQDIITKIRDYFNLNLYEAKVWMALLKKGVASAGEAAAISGIPRSRTYDVLESLEKMGFALAKLDKPVKYVGVKPKMIIEKIKNNIRKDAEDRVTNLSTLKDTEEFAQLESLYHESLNPVKREEMSAALKGRQNISNHLKEIIQNSKKEVIICTNVGEFLLKSKLFQQTFDILKRLDVKINIALSGDAKLIKEASEKMDIKIKKINIDSKFFIVDRNEILFYMSKDGGDDDIAIWLNSEFFAQAFASLFEKALGK
ncbi:MAG: helix-turn-helix domain-containing protein [Nanoarchaeota archaeon]